MEAPRPIEVVMTSCCDDFNATVRLTRAVALRVAPGWAWRSATSARTARTITPRHHPLHATRQDVLASLDAAEQAQRTDCLQRRLRVLKRHVTTRTRPADTSPRQGVHFCSARRRTSPALTLPEETLTTVLIDTQHQSAERNLLAVLVGQRPEIVRMLRKVQHAVAHLHRRSLRRGGRE